LIGIPSKKLQELGKNGGIFDESSEKAEFSLKTLDISSTGSRPASSSGCYKKDNGKVNKYSP